MTTKDKSTSESLLPLEALSLYDSLINNLIDATERYSVGQIQQPRQMIQKNSNKQNSGTMIETKDNQQKCEFDHSSLYSSDNTKTFKRCIRDNNSLVYEYSNNNQQKIDKEIDKISNKVSLTSIRNYSHEIIQNDSSPYSSCQCKYKKLNNNDYCNNKNKNDDILDRRKAGKDVINNSNVKSFFMMQDTPSITTADNHLKSSVKNTRVEQNAFLTTKRLANNRDGCELSFSTLDAEGKPLVIRAVCPDFEPRRVWLNGKPLEYIDNESFEPILDGIDIKALVEQQERQRQRVDAIAQMEMSKKDNNSDILRFINQNFERTDDIQPTEDDTNSSTCECEDCKNETKMMIKHAEKMRKLQLKCMNNYDKEEPVNCDCVYCIDEDDSNNEDEKATKCTCADCMFSDTEYY